MKFLATIRTKHRKALTARKIHSLPRGHPSPGRRDHANPARAPRLQSGVTSGGRLCTIMLSEGGRDHSRPRLPASRSPPGFIHSRRSLPSIHPRHTHRSWHARRPVESTAWRLIEFIETRALAERGRVVSRLEHRSHDRRLSPSCAGRNLRQFPSSH